MHNRIVRIRQKGGRKSFARGLRLTGRQPSGHSPACAELGDIRPKNQRLIAVSIDGEQASPSVAQAKRLRELDKAGKLTGDIIDGILSEEKRR